MPRSPVVSQRYVRALSALTEEKNDAAKLLNELKAFQNVLKSNREVREFFFSPVIPKTDKREALGDLREKFPLTTRFLTTLVESNRLAVLDEIVEGFEASLESQSGELTVTLEIARNLPDSLIEEIRSLLQEKWKSVIKIKTVVNPEILGGFVARAPGKILDASVANQFESLKQTLVSP